MNELLFLIIFSPIFAIITILGMIIMAISIVSERVSRCQKKLKK